MDNNRGKLCKIKGAQSKQRTTICKQRGDSSPLRMYQSLFRCITLMVDVYHMGEPWRQCYFSTVYCKLLLFSLYFTKLVVVIIIIIIIIIIISKWTLNKGCCVFGKYSMTLSSLNLDSSHVLLLCFCFVFFSVVWEKVLIIFPLTIRSGPWVTKGWELLLQSLWVFNEKLGC